MNHTMANVRSYIYLYLLSTHQGLGTKVEALQACCKPGACTSPRKACWPASMCAVSLQEAPMIAKPSSRKKQHTCERTGRASADEPDVKCACYVETEIRIAHLQTVFRLEAARLIVCAFGHLEMSTWVTVYQEHLAHSSSSGAIRVSSCKLGLP